ncbi:hypothetical protein AA14337_2922 [Acetobacter malorum DSM 14337]|uniref:Phage protein n=1 Tax=Acetobacter malorum DSM 14337 TaxID=1307910 RepID=A0ABQ0PYL1_9PROT|nr:hypothetical protein [Acetobacter malorum]KXV06774.1 hypothetical protein AD930_06660 [Acetobacter malorum]GBQ84823.1 hypothetical protein AA14337_2922 [Acetobacter malorum DSM 14337]
MKITFSPIQHAIDLIDQIAADPSDPRHAAATAVMKEMEEAIAPPALTAAVGGNDELEVDSGTFMSHTDEGAWVQTWTWVPRDRVPELYPDDGEPEPSDEESPEP